MPDATPRQGRPPLLPEDLRSLRLTVRLSTAERQALSLLAAERGQTIADCLVSSALGSRGPRRPA